LKQKLATHIVCPTTHFFNCALYEIMWKSAVQRGRPQNTIWCMRIPCWTFVAINAHTGCVILIPLQQWLYERASMLRYKYVVCLVIHHHLLLLLPLALQPAVGFGLSKNNSPFFPICHQLSPSSHSQHLKISFYFFSPSFSGSSSSSRPFQFLSEDLFGHPILLHSLHVT
jgi:hypothetical protein